MGKVNMVRKTRIMRVDDDFYRKCKEVSEKLGVSTATASRILTMEEAKRKRLLSLK